MVDGNEKLSTPQITSSVQSPPITKEKICTKHQLYYNCRWGTTEKVDFMLFE